MQRYESALLDPSDEAHCNYPLLFAHFVGASFQGEKLVERVRSPQAFHSNGLVQRTSWPIACLI